jgi:hypothetical protein
MTIVFFLFKSNWLQRLTRKNNNRMPKKMFNYRRNGWRRLGRPLKRLLDRPKQVCQGLTRDGWCCWWGWETAFIFFWILFMLLFWYLSQATSIRVAEVTIVAFCFHISASQLNTFLCCWQHTAGEHVEEWYICPSELGEKFFMLSHVLRQKWTRYDHHLPQGHLQQLLYCRGT